MDVFFVLATCFSLMVQYTHPKLRLIFAATVFMYARTSKGISKSFTHTDSNRGLNMFKSRTSQVGQRCPISQI